MQHGRMHPVRHQSAARRWLWCSAPLCSQQVFSAIAVSPHKCELLQNFRCRAPRGTAGRPEHTEGSGQLASWATNGPALGRIVHSSALFL